MGAIPATDERRIFFFYFFFSYIRCILLLLLRRRRRSVAVQRAHQSVLERDVIIIVRLLYIIMIFLVRLNLHTSCDLREYILRVHGRAHT